MYKKILSFIILIIMLTSCVPGGATSYNSVFNIISSSENKDLEPYIIGYARENKININIDYYGTIDIMQILNQDSTKYDAAWLSNSIWLYMLNDPSVIKYSKFTSINPIVFGVKENKAKELGFVNTKVHLQDIVQAVNDNKLNFIMPSATQTNSGASAYLGFLSSLAGNPEVLTSEDLENETVKTQLKQLFKGVVRSSGDEAFTGELFHRGNYDAIVNYEASIIQLNKELVAKGEEPLYLIYPVDGVSLSDSPFAYIDNKKDEKKPVFENLQKFLLSENMQKVLMETGRRSGYGGLVENADTNTFNINWGIDTSKYLSPIKYPATPIIREALNLYQEELKKPSYTVFCLDYSGSMSGKGQASLLEAMNYILNYEEASKDFLQFQTKDHIEVIPFNSMVLDDFVTNNGKDTKEILQRIINGEVGGGTDIYEPAILALEKLKSVDPNEYTRSIILMTDGKSNIGSFRELEKVYREIAQDIPIYSITFGSADEEQLLQIAELTNAKVTNGTKNLLKAFKDVRAYN